MLRQLLILIWLLCLSMPAAVHAQNLPMTVDLRQTSQSPKGDGPLTLVWQCSVASTGLLEGYFLVTAHDGVQQFGQFRSNDVALHAGFHEIPMMLPPMKVDNAFSNVSLQVSFVTADRKYDLKNEFLLRVGRVYERMFAVGVCDSFDTSLSQAEKRLLDELKFEAISPSDPLPVDLRQILRKHGLDNRGYLTNRPLSLNMQTFSIYVGPAEFPQLPLDCHQYDILLITEQGLEALESRHLRAILQWVRSGGSLCVLAGENPKPSQVQFLNQLSENAGSTPFVLNSAGKLEQDEAQTTWFFRTGWGRSVIVTADAIANDSLSETHRRQIPFFLWKLRQSQQDYYAANQRWDEQPLINAYVDRVKQNHSRYGETYTPSEMFNLNYHPVSTGGAVVSSLMPEHLRIVPASLIMLILLCYVIVIGPGEYYVLGRFNLRRFTWITFPLISVGFAVIAFLISNYFMQTSHERKSLVIIDLDSQGRPVKENQIELIFTGSYQDVETPVKSGLLTSLNQLELGMGENYYRYSRGTDAALVGPPYYAGSIPTQYSVFQRMPQWTPQLNRIVNNYPQSEQPSFNWASIDTKQLTTVQGREQLKKQIEAEFGNQALVMIYNGTSAGKVAKYSMNHRLQHPSQNQTRYPSRYRLFNTEQYHNGIHNHVQQSFMDDLCVRNQGGLFQIVSQVSPSGGNNYEDLSILDPSAPGQWLVVIFIPGETHDTVYRQLLFSPSRQAVQAL
ncbi:hypothetical protein [Gimesia chilikensis]|uniref:hypothetical protein n=1 Tax=Gimesia chilikensis TaxID=2605989 RepID=UPI003A8FA86E